MRTASVASYASTSSSTLNQNLEFILNTADREKFEFYRKKESMLEKNSSSFLIGWQKRYFKLKWTKSFLLSYYKEEKINGEPQGVLNLANIEDIKAEGDKK